MMEIDINYLVKEYGNMISTIAHRMIQNKEIAREAAQDGMNFVKASVALKVIRRFLHGYILSLVALLADMQHVKSR